VEYTRDILKGTSDVYFFQSDARRPEDLLNRPEVEKILGGKRKVAFVYWGVSVFIEDEGITHMARYLYDWAAPGSCLVFNAQGVGFNRADPAMASIIKVYEQMGPVCVRTLEQYTEMLKPWKFEEKGFISLLEWHDFDRSELSGEDTSAFGPMGGGYGAYLYK
jgi:hypothetical protein